MEAGVRVCVCACLRVCVNHCGCRGLSLLGLHSVLLRLMATWTSVSCAFCLASLSLFLTNEQFLIIKVYSAF